MDLAADLLKWTFCHLIRYARDERKFVFRETYVFINYGNLFGHKSTTIKPTNLTDTWPIRYADENKHFFQLPIKGEYKPKRSCVDQLFKQES